MNTLLKWLNDQHWYIIALLVIASLFFWTYGCESQVESLITPGKKVTRLVIKAELNKEISRLESDLKYLTEIAKDREENLDRQDAAKQALLDAATVIGSTGSINPAGLVNIAATIAALSWGLKKNQQLKATTSEKLNT